MQLLSLPAVVFAADLRRGGVLCGYGRGLLRPRVVANSRDGNPRQSVGVADGDCDRDPFGHGGGVIYPQVSLSGLGLAFVVVSCTW